MACDWRDLCVTDYRGQLHMGGWWEIYSKIINYRMTAETSDRDSYFTVSGHGWHNYAVKVTKLN